MTSRAGYAGPSLSARRLNRATLARQLLLARETASVVDGVRRIVALQAQEPASPYVALWARLTDFDPGGLDQAFASRTVIKAHLLRITLHAVAASDHPAFHAAMLGTLRGARLYDQRFIAEGVSVAETDALIPELVAYASDPRTNRDVEAWLAVRLGRPAPRVWWAIRHYGPFIHAPTGGPWSFGPRPAYIAARQPPEPGDVAAASQAFVVRYLEGFGPATMADIAQFGPILRPPIRDAIGSLGDVLVRYAGPAGETLFDVRDGLVPDEDAVAPPRLLPMWDSTLLAYADRSRIVPPDLRAVVTRRNGDVLPTLLVDGTVAGVWRPTADGIEATAFRPLAPSVWAGLETEAASLIAFLAGREPLIYHGRFAHWWSKLPDGEVRVLGR